MLRIILIFWLLGLTIINVIFVDAIFPLEGTIFMNIFWTIAYWKVAAESETIKY